MKLFFFAWTTDDGDSLDWFVRAPSLTEAISSYLELVNHSFGLEDQDDILVVTRISGTWQSLDQAQVFEVPSVEGDLGAVEWDHQNAVYFTIDTNMSDTNSSTETSA